MGFRYSVLLFVVVCSCAAQNNFHPAPQWTTNFALWSQYNATLGFNQIAAPEPFIWSPPLGIFSGKMYFDWYQQGFRFDLSAATGSPYALQTSYIVHPRNISKGPNSFNATYNEFLYLSNGRCWTWENTAYDLPYELNGFSKNISYVGVQTVDGVLCLMFADNVSGNQFAIRATDLAIIRATMKGRSFIPVPIYELLGGFGNYSTWVDMYNPVLGAVNPSVFAIPSGPCIKSKYNVVSDIFSAATPTKLMDNLMNLATKRFPSDPIKAMAALKPSPKANLAPAQLREKRQTIPPLAQQFTADYTFVVNSTYYLPYQPYNIKGRIAFDFVNYGLRVDFSSWTGNVPWNLQTSFVIYPNLDGIEILQESPSGNCYSWFFLQWFWTYLFPPFEIPPDATYMGQDTVNGDLCTKWNYGYREQGLTLWVRVADGVPVKGDNYVDPTWTTRDGNFVLTNIKTSVDPSEYARPAVCAETMTWNPSWSSHLPWYWCYPYC